MRVRTRIRYKSLCHAVSRGVLLVLAGTAQTALAQNGFAIQGNQLTITGGNTGAAFSQSATFGADGVVSHVTNVPSTNASGFPPLHSRW